MVTNRGSFRRNILSLFIGMFISLILQKIYQAFIFTIEGMHIQKSASLLGGVTAQLDEYDHVFIIWLIVLICVFFLIAICSYSVYSAYKGIEAFEVQHKKMMEDLDLLINRDFVIPENMPLDQFKEISPKIDGQFLLSVEPCNS